MCESCRSCRSQSDAARSAAQITRLGGSRGKYNASAYARATGGVFQGSDRWRGRVQGIYNVSESTNAAGSGPTHIDLDVEPSRPVSDREAERPREPERRGHRRESFYRNPRIR